MPDTVVKIPDHLKPADGRFGSGAVPGPAPLSSRAYLAGPGESVMGTSHRQKRRCKPCWWARVRGPAWAELFSTAGWL